MKFKLLFVLSLFFVFSMVDVGAVLTKSTTVAFSSCECDCIKAINDGQYSGSYHGSYSDLYNCKQSQCPGSYDFATQIYTLNLLDKDIRGIKEYLLNEQGKPLTNTVGEDKYQCLRFNNPISQNEGSYTEEVLNNPVILYRLYGSYGYYPYGVVASSVSRDVDKKCYNKIYVESFCMSNPSFPGFPSMPPRCFPSGGVDDPGYLTSDGKCATAEEKYTISLKKDHLESWNNFDNEGKCWEKVKYRLPEYQGIEGWIGDKSQGYAQSDFNGIRFCNSCGEGSAGLFEGGIIQKCEMPGTSSEDAAVCAYAMDSFIPNKDDASTAPIYCYAHNPSLVDGNGKSTQQGFVLRTSFTSSSGGGGRGESWTKDGYYGSNSYILSDIRYPSGQIGGIAQYFTPFGDYAKGNPLILDGFELGRLPPAYLSELSSDVDYYIVDELTNCKAVYDVNNNIVDTSKIVCSDYYSSVIDPKEGLPSNVA